ncbi:hypothetical protein [Candidatus Leptofilum sp.]|uniref:hypothetical protein n=1 Tax=Candidatus Leptofilum sp. TaxID=3241576 RepID=UPI003B5A4719
MDPVTVSVVATSVVSLISTAIVNAGKVVINKSSKEVAKYLGDIVGKNVSAVLNTVISQASDKPAANEAVEDILLEPENEDVKAALRRQIEKLMKKDEEFANKLAELLEEAKSEAKQIGVNITVSGSGSAASSGGVAAGKGGVAVQGNVKGGISMGGSDKKQL